MENNQGSFIEKDVRGYHFYRANDELDDMTNSWRFPHKLITNDGFRYANIKKTVAEIAIDEDEYGQPVVEKWQIYSHKYS
jgi:hypothetical protein